MNLLRDNKEGKERRAFEGMGGGRDGSGSGHGPSNFVLLKTH